MSKHHLVLPLLAAALISLESCGFIVINNPKTDETSAMVTSAPDTSAADTTSSGVSSDATTSEPADPRADADEKLTSLHKKSFAGAGFIIASADGGKTIPTDIDDEVSAARLVSYRAVESKYTTKIIPISYTADELYEAARNAVSSGDYLADLLIIPADRLGQFMNGKLLANMNSLPFTDYTGSCYNDSVTSSAMFGSKLLAVSGAANLDFDKLSCVFFDKGLVHEDIYTLVKNGEWTWDKYREIAKEASGGNVYGHGSVLSDRDYIDAAALSMGIKYVSNPSGESPTVDYMSTDRGKRLAGGIVETLYGLFYTDSSQLSAGADASDTFSDGRLAVMTGRLSMIPDIADISTDWGLAPMPKYDKSQKEYISPLKSDAPVFSALVNTTDFGNSGLILEALNVSAEGYLSDIYLSDRVNYMLRDDGSIGSLETILSTASLDFTHMFASGFDTLDDATYGAIYSGVTTRNSIDALYRNYQPAADREMAKVRTDR